MVHYINANSAKLSNFKELQSNDIVIIHINNYHVGGVVDIVTFGTDDITLLFMLHTLCYNDKQIDTLPDEAAIKFDIKNSDVVYAGLYGINYNML